MSKYLGVTAIALALFATPAVAEIAIDNDPALPGGRAFTTSWNGMGQMSLVAVGSVVPTDATYYAQVDGRLYLVDPNHRVLAIVR